MSEEQIVVPQEEPELPVIDDSEDDETVVPIKYEITSFGADYDAEGMVKRLQRDDIFIPPFQRDYVWSHREASRFIESLLLGLPIPGIFLARESDTKRLLVIDGQQRLKTLRFFYEGVFNPDPESETRQVFRLLGVQPQYVGKTYATLDDKDRIVLNDSIIHATIVKQELPQGEQSSVYHIFERLNTSGRKLSPHQIRVAIYHGGFIELIRELNGLAPWRAIFGRRSRTLKDQELILRFLALLFDQGSYERPMNEFLNDFVAKASKKGVPSLEQCSHVFEETISAVHAAVGDKAFRPERALNAAVFDAVMVGLSRRIAKTPKPTPPEIKREYDILITNPRFTQLVSRGATADDKNVKERIALAQGQFSSIGHEKP